MQRKSGISMKSSIRSNYIRLNKRLVELRTNHEYRMYEKCIKDGNFNDALIHYGAYRILEMILWGSQLYEEK